jgi:hypothetical protein
MREFNLRLFNYVSYTTEASCQPPLYFFVKVPVTIIVNPEYSIVTQQNSRKYESGKASLLCSGSHELAEKAAYL